MSSTTLAALLIAPFIGSFLSLLIVRLPTGEAWVRSRSKCAVCTATLGVRDLIPVVSWIALRGRCRRCGAQISALYPVIEIAAVVIAVWAALVTPDFVVLPTCVLGWLLLTTSAIDAREGYLPDGLSAVLVATGLATASVLAPERLGDHVIGMLVGAGALSLIAMCYRALRRRGGLGWGDVKLFGAAGAWVGWQGLTSVLLIASVTGIVAALVITRLKQRTLLGETSLAFGPYIAVGVWLTWLYGPFASPFTT